MLIKYFTKFTDYLVNEKYPVKDLAVAKEYLEPFQWDLVEVDRLKLGGAAKLLTGSFQSDNFWQGLRQSH